MIYLNGTQLLWTVFLSLILCSVTGCKQTPADGEREEQLSSTPQPAEASPTAVKTVLLENTSFPVELIANGKVQARQRADLRFRTDGVIQTIDVREGQHVAAGALLATLDDNRQQTDLRQARLDQRRALLDYEDQLLRSGYRLADTAALDTEIKTVARLRSGLAAAEIALERATSALAQTRLTAPFAGTIANLNARPFNQANAFDYICTLVGDGALRVEFKVLEQEIPFIRNSRTASVSAFSAAEESYMGEITNINPLVDEGGMVSVSAQLKGPSNLLDGMSVRVIVGQALADQLAVPKEAVLDRQGRKVVFTLENGLAKWNYVEIARENSTQYAIASGLNAGDEVIYTGNFNLAHDKPVTKAD